jgi:hypothetical protein
MKIFVGAIIILALSFPGNTQAPAGKAPAPAEDACKKQARTAHTEGYVEGLVAGGKLWDVPISSAGKPIPVSFTVEDIEESSSYQYAAAEVVRLHFLDWLVVVPKAPSSCTFLEPSWQVI